MDTYRLSYAPSIHPMPGPSDWPIDRDVDPIKPPIPKPQRHRPKKLKRRGIDETEANESVKVTRKGYDVCCRHNARSCSQLENPNRKKFPKRVTKPKPKPTTVSSNIIFF
jgi:hypothetical protein